MNAAGFNAAVLGDSRTIAAIATPPGRGALAMVRVSGPGVRELAEKLLCPVPSKHRHAMHCAVRDTNGIVIDDVVATLFLGPHSFTGEDLLEISTHGGSIVPAVVLAATIHAGARQAERGEFTRRAVLNGKLDVLQAEAIGDLIDARSFAAHQRALRQLDGGLSRRTRMLRTGLLELEALLVYDIDFPDEDDGPVPSARIVDVAVELLRALEILLATSEQGTLVHDGALVVLTGATNVGKSSLFNALLGEARAIVTELPGTTRDAIEAILDLPEGPLRLVDTAGLRETSDAVERLGIETSSRYLGRAAIVLACVDSVEAMLVVKRLRELTRSPIIVVVTKGDIVPESVKILGDVVVSAYTGDGLDTLLWMIKAKLTSSRRLQVLDAPVLTRARHRVAVECATTELKRFLQGWRDDMLPPSVLATHVQAAARALDELIGVVHVNDVLDVVFRTFCVGK